MLNSSIAFDFVSVKLAEVSILANHASLPLLLVRFLHSLGHLFRLSHSFDNLALFGLEHGLLTEFVTKGVVALARKFTFSFRKLRLSLEQVVGPAVLDGLVKLAKGRLGQHKVPFVRVVLNGFSQNHVALLQRLDVTAFH